MTGKQGLFLLLFYALLEEIAAQSNCDKVFSTFQSNRKSGVFQSPGYPSHYPNGVSCKFKFIAGSNERVKINFTNFSLQGRRPTCTNDFVNVYSELERESDDLLEAKLSGPFCGQGQDALPSLIVSTGHLLIIAFNTNHEKSNTGFNGTWEFIPTIDMGTAAPQMCGYTVRSENRMRGFIASPTYPGVYQNNLFCFYKLQGRPGQRVKLTFEDFSLFYGDNYCPFDYLRIYDGYTTSHEEIGKFCGSYNRSTVIYSSTEALRLDFVTGEDRLNFRASPQEADADFKFERRGFNITYEFSERFVKLDSYYIKDGATHVRGTECDLRIMSGKETNGTFVSPSYPDNFPGDIMCRYYLDGLMDEQNLEKVKVEFFDFHIPGNMPYCLLGYLGENEDGRLSAGNVKQKFCGKYNPPVMTSTGPRMVITLNTSGSVHGGKFVARYKFITDYAIRGEQIEEGKCMYHYPSSKTKAGYINSPRHPSKYPLKTTCEYIFRPLGNEVVMISFQNFELSEKDNLWCNSGDYVAFYEDLGTRNKPNYTLIEKHCGQVSPGPYATSRLLKVVFHSDNFGGFVGFKANYRFVKKTYLEATCTTKRIDARGSGDVVVSPNYPDKYSPLTRCEWLIHASKKKNRILVELSDVNTEGIYGKQGKKSTCPNVVLRLYDDTAKLTPVEAICGKVEAAKRKSYISYRDSFKISFVTSQSSLGGNGFKISWTELHMDNPSLDCRAGFQCATSKYCISSSLKCNNEPNCGEGDDSDETAECPKTSGVQILHIAIGTSISSFFCIILLICGFYHRRKFRSSERAPPDHDHVEVRYVSAPTGCNTTDRLLMEERNDTFGSSISGGGVGENHNNSSGGGGGGGHNTTQSPRCQKVSMV